jgi:peptide deformylase
MAILTILHFPDPRLRNKAEPVAIIDESVEQLVNDMLETMYAAPGIGLAAIQVNIPKRVIVVDVSEERNEPVCVVNPEIRGHRGTVETEEGCLSVPGIYESVRRSEWIEISGQSPSGDAFTLEADGLLAVCIQHEVDHLDGKLFVDYLSELKRQRIRKKSEKRQRETM